MATGAFGSKEGGGAPVDVELVLGLAELELAAYKEVSRYADDVRHDSRSAIARFGGGLSIRDVFFEGGDGLSG
jgi:hypothetical protein